MQVFGLQTLTRNESKRRSDAQAARSTGLDSLMMDLSKSEYDWTRKMCELCPDRTKPRETLVEVRYRWRGFRPTGRGCICDSPAWSASEASAHYYSGRRTRPRLKGFGKQIPKGHRRGRQTQPMAFFICSVQEKG